METCFSTDTSSRLVSDLGDHWSCYCVLDEAGKIILEQKVAMTPEAMKQTFAKIPQSLIALETGTHSPWVSRLLTELGYKGVGGRPDNKFCSMLSVEANRLGWRPHE
jgi:hypothetical protein